jgi:hypothetical protein
MLIGRLVRWAVLLPCLVACSGSALKPADDGHAPTDGSLLAMPMVHRSAATPCPTERPTPMCMHVAPGAAPVNGGNCVQDGDCTSGQNGRCGPSSPNDGNCDTCSYDECFADSDCSGRGPCDCRAGDVTGANVCKAGNCRVDADCGPRGYCSPSISRCPYPDVETASVGYFCRTSKDTCVDDKDCDLPNSSQECRYDAAAGHWRCIDFPPCPA